MPQLLGPPGREGRCHPRSPESGQHWPCPARRPLHRARRRVPAAHLVLERAVIHVLQVGEHVEIRPKRARLQGLGRHLQARGQSGADGVPRATVPQRTEVAPQPDFHLRDAPVRAGSQPGLSACRPRGDAGDQSLGQGECLGLGDPITGEDHSPPWGLLGLVPSDVQRPIPRADRQQPGPSSPWPPRSPRPRTDCHLPCGPGRSCLQVGGPRVRVHRAPRPSRNLGGKGHSLGVQASPSVDRGDPSLQPKTRHWTHRSLVTTL